MSEEAATAEAVEVSPKIAGILESIEKLTVLEASELVKALEDRFGVSAAPQAMAMAPMAGAAAGGEAAAEEKTEFDVVLTAVGDKKIQVIKVVRAITGLGLKEAKALVDEAPKPIKEAVPKAEADEIKEKIEEAGGQVDIK
jgi:large subunit ribosomal protein L7/L12